MTTIPRIYPFRGHELEYMKTEKLRHCPFCGSNNAPRAASSTESWVGVLSRYADECFFVICDASAAATPPGCGAQSGYAISQEDAIAKWNRRSATDVLDAAIADPSADRIKCLESALRFYAAGHHFVVNDPTAWDTVTGEPQNFQCDNAGTATCEDGTIAKKFLLGEWIEWEPGEQLELLPEEKAKLTGKQP